SPNKLWEYPAAGVPILATDMPEMEKQITSYGIGLTVSRDLDPQEIAGAVNALTDADLEQLTANCGTYAVAENWQNYESRLVNLHTSLAREHGIVGGEPEPAAASPRDAHPAPESIWRRIAALFGRK